MRQKGTMVVALLCGLVCAFSVFAYTRVVQADAAAARSEAMERFGGDQIEVCVATRDIAPGEEVSAANTTSRMWLVDLLPGDAVTALADVAGKQVTSAVIAGEVLSMKRFQGESVSVVVPQGLQAVTVELSEAQAVGGMLQAGSIVDVYATGTSTALLVERVLVTALEQSASGAKRVTLAVSAEHVQEIIAATSQSALYLVLPSRGESSADAGAEGEATTEGEAAMESDAAAAGEAAAGQPTSEGSQQQADDPGAAVGEAQPQAATPDAAAPEAHQQPATPDVPAGEAQRQPVAPAAAGESQPVAQEVNE